jgi:hypothetical protein
MGGRLRLTKHNVNPKHMGYLLNSFNDLSESSTVLDVSKAENLGKHCKPFAVVGYY